MLRIRSEEEVLREKSKGGSQRDPEHQRMNFSSILLSRVRVKPVEGAGRKSLNPAENQHERSTGHNQSSNDRIIDQENQDPRFTPSTSEHLRPTWQRSIRAIVIFRRRQRFGRPLRRMSGSVSLGDKGGGLRRRRLRPKMGGTRIQIRDLTGVLAPKSNA